MNFLRTGLFTALTSLMILSGCGDLFQKDVKDNSLESNKFRANCELNIDEFALIMEEPIGDAIDCLGKNLRLFVKAVESKRPGYLSRKALENYIKRNRKDIKPEVLNALKSVFDINFLIYGEDPDFISTANIDALVNFAKLFNDKAATNFKPIFMDTDDINYDNYRQLRDQRIKGAALAIASGLREIFKTNRNGQVHKLDILNLLESFTTDNNGESMAKVRKLLFAKRVLLGGNKDEITHLELARLVENFSSYVLLTLDAVRSKHIRMDQESLIHFLNADVELLQNLIYSPSMGNRDGEFFFSLQDAIGAAEIFFKDLDLDDYYDLLKEGKQILMEGDAETITGKDLKKLFAHGLNVLKTGTYFHRFWASERVFLEFRPGRPIPANYEFKNLYTIFNSEKGRIDDFVRILKKYRFQKGENIAAFYTDEYHRNANAVFEIGMVEYAMKLVMKRFGCPNNTVNGSVVCNTAMTAEHAHMGKDYVYMTKDQVTNLIQKFQKALVKAELILPGREVNTAETITLLGSLFQYQSDENKVFDVNEATEFTISLFSSISIAEDVNDHFQALAKNNECTIDSYGRVEPGCFKKNFFRAVCLNYPDQFPKLYSSLGATVYENGKLVCKIPQVELNTAYLQRSIEAARTCNFYPSNKTEEIYYSKGDMMSVFLAMMHIETTILRWDVRKMNNTMDPDEVMDAYNIYSPALDGFLEKMPSIVKKLKKQIYQYLVKYEQVPNEKEFSSIWKFVKFLVSFNKSAPANRKTVASILVTISQQGAPDTFNCECLRTPNDIPEDQTTCSSSVGPISSVLRPARMTVGDKVVAMEIEADSDAKVRKYLESEFPEIFETFR